MKDIKNHMSRHLENDEYVAIIEVVRILEKAFKKKVFIANINPYEKEASLVYGINIIFDLAEEGYK